MKRLFLCALAFHAAAAFATAQTPTEAAPPAPPTANTSTVNTPENADAPAARPATVKVEAARFVPDEIFEAEMKDLDDFSFRLGEYRGRVFVLNLWASWCGPCRLEIPELNRLHEEFAPRGVEFVGLTVENPGAESEKVREFTREFKMAYRLAWADPDVAEKLMTRRAIPQTIVVGSDGRIVARFVGYSKKVSQLLRAAVERALAPPEEEEEAEPAPAAPAAPPPPAAPETSRPPCS